MNSIELIEECERTGLLSKEASAETKEVRLNLYKEACMRQAYLLVDDVHGDSMPKTANIMSALKGFMRKAKGHGESVAGAVLGKGEATALSRLKTLGIIGAAAAPSAYAVDKLVENRQKHKLQNQLEKSYGQMFEMEPDLNEHVARGKRDDIRRRFQVLSTYAPSLAGNPMVAGAWVNNSMGMANPVDPAIVKQLSDTQNSIDKVETREHVLGTNVTKNLFGAAKSILPAG
jgi:hypothetical protein